MHCVVSEVVCVNRDVSRPVSGISGGGNFDNGNLFFAKFDVTVM